jgi:hypothetical protein
MDNFLKFKVPSLFTKHKRVFSVKRHFVVESAENVCGSRALQAVITKIAELYKP